MTEEIYLIKITYPNEKIENIPGIIDCINRIIKVIEVDEESASGFKVRGFINMDYVKRVDMLKRIGSI